MANITFQYIWVEKYRCFDNMEFNFSAKHHFHYDKSTNILTHENHSENYVEDFFGENIDLTAVIGNNGSGKTTLTKMICENFADGCGGIQTNCIVVLQVGTQLKCYYYLNAKKENGLRTLELTSKSDYIECFNLAEQNSYNEISIYEENKKSNNMLHFPTLFELENAQPSIRFVRLTQTLDYSDYREELYGAVTDLSTSWILWEQNDKTLGEFFWSQNEKLPDDGIKSYFHYNFEKQIDFFCNYMKNKETNHIILFNRPNYVEVFVDTGVSNALIDLKKENRDDKVSKQEQIEIETITSNFWNENQGMTRDIYTTISKGVVANCFRSISSLHTDNKKLYSIIKTVMNNVSKSNCSPIERCKNLFENLKCEIEIKYKIEPFKSTFLIDYIENHISFLEFIAGREFKLNNNFFANSFTISLDLINDHNNHSNINVLCGIKKFYKEYKKIAGRKGFLDFSWNLSSGEMALLNVYSRFFSVAKKNNRKRNKYFLPIDKNGDQEAENAFIIIDEADMLLHPEWQKEYVNSVIPFLKDIYSGTHLQIIIATHSPIMLSDIPKQNVIYIGCNNEKKPFIDDTENHAETFGANIFRLYNDAFFLEEGVIGAFAEKKISDLLKMIDDSADEKSDEIQKLIYMIGDSFLKSKVEAYFLSKLEQNKNSEQQRMIEKEIAMLNQKLNDLKAKEGKLNGEN